MSTKSVAEKLLIKPNTTVWSSHASRADLIDPLPENVSVVDAPDEATTAAALTRPPAGVRAADERCARVGPPGCGTIRE